MLKAKRMLAAALALSLVIPFTVGRTAQAAYNGDPVVHPAGNALSAHGSKAAITPQPTAESLLELVRANRLENIDMETYGDFQFTHEERNTNSSDLLTMEAQNLDANADGVPMEYQLYDINQDGTPELFMVSPASGVRAGVNIYRHDTYHMQVDHVKTIGGVTIMFKNPRKKQVVFVTSSSAYRTDIITYKMTNAGKLKKVVTYTQNGKKYKKNKKKISKAKFDKYFKSLDKLKQIRPRKIPTEEIPATITRHYVYYNKDVYYYEVYADDYSDAIVMTKANRTDSAPQDKFLAFRMIYDRLDNGEYMSDPVLRRYVFGPDVTNPGTGKTFQQEDWESMQALQFGESYACPYFRSTVGEDGKKVLDIEADGTPKVTTEAGTAKNGDVDYKTLIYSFEYGDSVVVMSFFSEGPLIGRIAKVETKYPNITGEVPFETYTYVYGVENTGYPEWDPVIDVQIRGEGVSTGLKDAKNRTLTIDSTTPEYKQTIVANENVGFQLAHAVNAQFYTYQEDGTTKWILDPQLTSTDENVKIDDIMNPSTGQLTYGEPKFDKGLFWELK